MLKRLFYGTIFLLSSAATLQSADIKIEGEKSVPQYSFASLSVRVASNEQVRWRITPPPVKRETPKEGQLYFGGIPGTKYQVEVDVISVELLDNKPVLKWNTGSEDITFLGTNPLPPGPNPPGPLPPVPPGPLPPGPVVVDPNAWFVVVEETSQRTPELALMLDYRIWNEVVTTGKYRFYDRNSPDAIQRKYDKLAEQEIRESGGTKSLPIILAVKDNGDLIQSKSLPKNKADLQAFHKLITGK